MHATHTACTCVWGLQHTCTYLGAGSWLFKVMQLVSPFIKTNGCSCIATYERSQASREAAWQRRMTPRQEREAAWQRRMTPRQEREARRTREDEHKASSHVRADGAGIYMVLSEVYGVAFAATCPHHLEMMRVVSRHPSPHAAQE